MEPTANTPRPDDARTSLNRSTPAAALPDDAQPSAAHDEDGFNTLYTAHGLRPQGPRGNEPFGPSSFPRHTDAGADVHVRRYRLHGDDETDDTAAAPMHEPSPWEMGGTAYSVEPPVAEPEPQPAAEPEPDHPVIPYAGVIPSDETAVVRATVPAPKFPHGSVVRRGGAASKLNRPLIGGVLLGTLLTALLLALWKPWTSDSASLPAATVAAHPDAAATPSSAAVTAETPRDTGDVASQSTAPDLASASPPIVMPPAPLPKRVLPAHPAPSAAVDVTSATAPAATSAPTPPSAEIAAHSTAALATAPQPSVTQTAPLPKRLLPTHALPAPSAEAAVAHTSATAPAPIDAVPPQALAAPTPAPAATAPGAEAVPPNASADAPLATLPPATPPVIAKAVPTPPHRAAAKAATAGNKPQAQPSSSAPAAAMGTLTITLKPWGEVWVDGVKRGISPPLLKLQLTQGIHLVELRNPGLPSYSQSLAISAGQSVTLQHRFQ